MVTGKMCRVVAFIAGFMPAALLCPVRARAGNDEFQKAVADYQRTQSDEAVRKVIQCAAAMPESPPVPEEARKHYVKGSALFPEAKSGEDYAQVVSEFKEAVHLAPWWPEARTHLALALESSGDYASAIDNLNHYLLFRLPVPEARAVQDKIYVLEAKQEKASRIKASPATQARPEEAKKGLGDLAGNWYRKKPYDRHAFPYDDRFHYRAEMRDGSLRIIEVTDETYWGRQKGTEKEWFIASGLEGHQLIGKPAAAAESDVLITVSGDFNEWTFAFRDQYQKISKTYIRK